jgi:hypothetical protein
VIASSIPQGQLCALLSVRGVARVRNQHGLELDLRFDMDQESLVAEFVDPGRTVDGDSSATPKYLFEFPTFGRLDVQLRAGFIDVSWHKNTCPSFELPSLDEAAEWPALTLFIDYQDQDEHESVEAPASFYTPAATWRTGWLLPTTGLKCNSALRRSVRSWACRCPHPPRRTPRLGIDDRIARQEVACATPFGASLIPWR